jgi:hypothetical protein
VGAAHRRPVWPWALVLLAALAVSTAILGELWPLFASIGGFRPQTSTARPSAPESLGERYVTLVIPAGDGRFIQRQHRIQRRPLLADEVRAVLEALRRDAHVPPAGTEIRHVFLDAFGILYVDLDRQFQEWLEASSAAADPAIVAMVATLSASFEPIRRVQVLVEGEALAAQAGQLDLRRPVRPPDPEPPAPPADPGQGALPR